jgi:hypothetical protein
MVRALLIALALAFASGTSPARGDEDALKEVNAKRATRGLPPFAYDAGLTQAAEAAAKFRAERLIFGHVSDTNLGDFRFLPPGVKADSAGCAAYEDRYGWMSCCTWEGYTAAGAAWARGADGKRYMHLFVRGEVRVNQPVAQPPVYRPAPPTRRRR